jgi:hypothetical protein
LARLTASNCPTRRAAHGEHVVAEQRGGDRKSDQTPAAREFDHAEWNRPHDARAIAGEREAERARRAPEKRLAIENQSPRWVRMKPAVAAVSKPVNSTGDTRKDQHPRAFHGANAHPMPTLERTIFTASAIILAARDDCSDRRDDQGH